MPRNASTYIFTPGKLTNWAFAYIPCASTSCGVGNMAAVWCDGTMNDITIRTAVTEWFSDRAAAKATYGHIKKWDTSGVKNMKRLFDGKTSFNDDISAWDTSGVKDTYYMFNGAKKFDQPIGDWQLDKVTTMEGMFRGAKAFDQDLGWCFDEDVNLKFAFKDTKCVSRSCGVSYKDGLGLCEPFARPCLIGRTGNNSECHINSPTLIIMIMLVLLAGAGAYVHRRKKEDETYVAAARRLLTSWKKEDETYVAAARRLLTSWWAPQEPEGPDAQSEADASAAGEDVASTPETEVEESAPEEEEGWGAWRLQRLAFWRTEDPPEEEEMRAEVATATATEEEV